MKKKIDKKVEKRAKKDEPNPISNSDYLELGIKDSSGKIEK